MKIINILVLVVACFLVGDTIWAQNGTGANNSGRSNVMNCTWEIDCDSLSSSEGSDSLEDITVCKGDPDDEAPSNTDTDKSSYVNPSLSIDEYCVEDPSQTRSGTITKDDYTWTYDPDPSTLVDTPDVYDITLKGEYYCKGSIIDTLEYSFKFTVLEAVVQSVSFLGNDNHTILSDDGATEYRAPHWLDNNLDGQISNGENDYPTVYVRNTAPKVTAKIVLVEDDPDATFLIKGSAGSMNFPEMEADKDGTTLTYPETEADSPFNNTVDHFPAFTINWEISSDDGDTWCPAGSSTNEIFVTLETPVNSYQDVFLGTPSTYTAANNGGFTDGVSTIITATVNSPQQYLGAVALQSSTATLYQYSMFCQAIPPNKGETSTQSIIDKIWSAYSGASFSLCDGTPLKYYNDWTSTNRTASDLLKNKDGTCEAWTNLFNNTIRSAGIGTSSIKEILPDYTKDSYAASGFFINNWNIPAAGTNYFPIKTAFPYLSYAKGPVASDVFKNNSFNFGYSDIIDKPGIAGQNNPNPNSLFSNHKVVKIGTTIYDPSYGTKFNSLQEWENASVAAYATGSDYVIADEPFHQKDFNGDGKKDFKGELHAIGSAKNPAGLQVK